jgi:hypothetical protein
MIALLGCGLVHAQGTAASASSPAKKELVAKVLQSQQGSAEALARNLVEQPALQLLQVIQPQIAARIPADKRDALFKDIQGDARKFVDEAVPIARERAIKLAPTTLGPMLEERFTEDELKVLLTFLESPVIRKYQQMAGDMQKALADKLVADVGPTIEPKLKAMQQSVAKRLDAALNAANATGAAKPAASTPKK